MATHHHKHRRRPPSRVPVPRRWVSRSSRARSRSPHHGSYRYTRSWPERSSSPATPTHQRPTTLPRSPCTPQNWPQHESWEGDHRVPGEQSGSVYHHHTPQRSYLLQEKGPNEITYGCGGFCFYQGKKWGATTAKDPI